VICVNAISCRNREKKRVPGWSNPRPLRRCQPYL
jgi:hypothetical protein